MSERIDPPDVHAAQQKANQRRERYGAMRLQPALEVDVACARKAAVAAERNVLDLRERAQTEAIVAYVRHRDAAIGFERRCGSNESPDLEEIAQEILDGKWKETP